jgi:hypothetical protein
MKPFRECGSEIFKSDFTCAVYVQVQQDPPNWAAAHPSYIAVDCRPCVGAEGVQRLGIQGYR